MKIRYSTTVISALLLSLCLAALIPAGLENASTWRELYFQVPGLRIQNDRMPIGFFSLGFVMIGLIVLWTGYRKRERWAWFVMLIILLFFIFPAGFLPLLLQQTIVVPGTFGSNLSTIDLSREMKWILEGNHLAIGLMMQLLLFPVMLIVLLLPIKAFFWKSHNTSVRDEHNEQDGGFPVADNRPMVS